MIFRQYEAIIRKLKTETRRTSEKDTYKVNHEYSVVPKRAQPTVYYQWCSDFSAWGYESIAVTPRLEIWHELHGDRFKTPKVVTMPPYWAGLENWKPLKVLILEKRWEHLHDIDEAGAIAEGIQVRDSLDINGHRIEVFYHDLSRTVFFSAVEAYQNLWDLINSKSKIYRWSANPLVCVHRFEIVE